MVYLSGTGFEQLVTDDYWSSTTGYSAPFHVPSTWSGLDNVYDGQEWTNNPKQVYKVASARHAFVQNFNDGDVTSKLRDGTAKLRLVKRVPIYVVSKYCYTPQAYPNMFDCPDINRGPCSCSSEEIT